MLLFVMAYHSRMELERFQLILDHWQELVEMRSPFRFLFVRTIEAELRTDMPRIDLRRHEDAGRPALDLVAEEFLEVSRYIEENVDCRCWFWWEQDVLPVRKDCFEFFLRRWHERCQVMGYRVRDNQWGMRNRINGVAFYARSYWSHVASHVSPGAAFDTWKAYTRRKDGNAFVQLNPWYALVHHERGPYLTPVLRLVHGVRDTSLLDDLLGGTRKHRRVSRLHRALRIRLRAWRINWRLARSRE